MLDRTVYWLFRLAILLTRPLPPELRQSMELYVGCVAGAALRADYLELMRGAGFTSIEVIQEGRYAVGADALPMESPERAVFEAVASVTVRAIKA